MVVIGRELVIVFAGGGTGGHLYPMLSVAEAIARRAPRARFIFLTTNRPIDRRVLDAADKTWIETSDIVAQPVRPLPRSISGVPAFIRAWRESKRLCEDLFDRHAPDLVLGSGGYGSAAPVIVAHKRGLPTALLNPDAVPGRANRKLASKADTVFVQWPVTRAHFRRSAAVRVVGCPVRSAFAAPDRAAGMRRFKLDAARKTLLITGASSGARSINEAMIGAIEVVSRVPGWQILHLAGWVDAPMVQFAYRLRSVSAVVVDYTEHMHEALAASDLVVTRAGAGSLAEITAVGVPSVLMPYPHHRDRHQYANAAVLTDVAAAMVVEDSVSAEANASRLADELPRLMLDDDRRAAMALSAARLGRHDAAETIAGHLLAAIRGHGLVDTHGAAAVAGDDDFCSVSSARDDDESISGNAKGSARRPSAGIMHQ